MSYILRKLSLDAMAYDGRRRVRTSSWESASMSARVRAGLYFPLNFLSPLFILPQN